MSFSFPPDIEQDIFEWAIYTCPAEVHLTLLCKRVQIYVERIIYDSIKLCGRRHGCNTGYIEEGKFSIALKSKPASFFKQHVRKIVFDYNHPVSYEFFLDVLSRCTAVEDLSFGLVNGSASSMLDHIKEVPLHRLAVDFIFVRYLLELTDECPIMNSLKTLVFSLGDGHTKGIVTTTDHSLLALEHIEINVYPLGILWAFANVQKFVKTFYGSLKSINVIIKELDELEKLLPTTAEKIQEIRDLGPKVTVTRLDDAQKYPRCSDVHSGGFGRFVF